MESSSSITQIPQQPEEEQNQDQKKKHSYLHTWACSILLVIVNCLVIWFKVHPKRFCYTVENAIIRDFAISSAFNPRSNVTEERLRSTFFVMLYTYNPNHQVTLHYESIDVSPMDRPSAEDLKQIKKLLDPIKVDVKMRTRAIFMVPPLVKDQRKLKIVCLGVMAHFTASTVLEKTGCYVNL